MAWSNGEIILFFILIIIFSILTAWIYRKITGGTVRYKAEREGIKVGKVYSRGSEKIVRKR